MLLQTLGLIVIFIVAIVVIVDLIPLVKDWVLRIQIGRYEDKTIWNEKITNKGSYWLLHTPKIKVTDHTRLTVIDRLKGNYTNSAIQHWQEAALLLGLSEYYKNSDEEEVKNRINKFLSLKFNDLGQWKEEPKHIDAAILAYAVMKLDFVNTDHYKKALDTTWEMIQSHIGADGTVEYRKFMKSYRYVDTIGFICPFLVTYGVKYGKEECIDLAVKQIQEYERHGMLRGEYLPCHVYKLENKVPLGLYGWGRGLGWFAIGLIDAWAELPHHHRYKSILEKSVEEFAKTAMKFQQENGSWNWTVTRGEANADSSATATLNWLMLNASTIKRISKDCLQSYERSIDYLMNVTRRDGAVDFSQGDTKDIGVYSRLFNILPFTQGFSIRCINRYMNIQQEERRLRDEDHGIYSHIQ
ncbi:glycoside hydrolase family 88 protein [Domibacillus sp.]|uniref:glycoside hydrolase family 88 protein n=1 Tax=Domibacillus sp. TaxID=1969783 RepID=UPI002811651A|nr:glycoside hydrolase family 88 protein [Domibacillus sp.]